MIRDARPVEDFEARVFAREREVAVAHAFVEAIVLAFETIGLRAGRERTRCDALARDRKRHVDEQREIRFASARRGVRECAQHREIQAAPVALICERRIGEAIADHRRAARERRLDHIGDVLRARRIHDERFRKRIDRNVRIHEGRAKQIPERSAAGFARCDEHNATLAELTDEPGQKCGFSAAFDPLDRDKSAGAADRYKSAYAETDPYGRSFVR